jgi:hypothetical protein
VKAETCFSGDVNLTVERPRRRQPPRRPARGDDDRRSTGRAGRAGPGPAALQLAFSYVNRFSMAFCMGAQGA